MHNCIFLAFQPTIHQGIAKHNFEINIDHYFLQSFYYFELMKKDGLELEKNLHYQNIHIIYDD